MFWIKNGRQYREQTSQKISWGHWFAFFNIIWAVAIGSRYAFLIDWPHTFLGRLYFFISILGHFSFIAFGAYLLVLFPLSFIIKNERTFRGVSVIIATIAITLLLVDTEVFSRFNLHLSSVVWNLLVNPENGELSRDWQIFFTPMPLMLLAQMLFSRWAWYRLRSLERQKWIRGVGILLTCLFITTHLIYAWADAYLYRPITMQKSNFPLSYPMTARTFLEKHGLLDKQKYETTLDQDGRLDSPMIHYPKQALSYNNAANKTNLLIITVAGLRQDAVHKEKMPVLTEFAQQATQFTNHYTTANSSNSAIVGLFYGLNANYTDSLLNNKKTSVLVEKMQQEDYQFGLFSATNFKQSIFRQALFHQITLPSSSNHQKIDNESAVKNWQLWFAQKSTDKAWFSYLNLDISGLTRQQHLPTLVQEQQFYTQQLGQLDEQLNAILTTLKMQNALQNTVVIITGEQGYTFQKSEDELFNYFAPEEISVPMIVAWKGFNTGIENKLTSHIDVVPTLMYNLFGVKNPNIDYTQGNNLFDHSQSLNEWVLVANYRWNVIITPDGTQYHIDNKGNYQKYDRAYQKVSSIRPPLGLFLDVYQRNSSFFEK
ncbi:DUF3413 domain-containing protein [Lonepinella koalarum]|uniref:DUF3413 domain-containing protein n=1 Tax=Lonepinella koalarum TaxID=53417 RepID=UPI0011E430EF|nr:DUF3413 domain-containing protein [Lonepinella koalarum]TYG34013.1 DUF3413 domain-containing protein [Lonepinella koalarum]